MSEGSKSAKLFRVMPHSYPARTSPEPGGFADEPGGEVRPQDGCRDIAAGKRDEALFLLSGKGKKEQFFYSIIRYAYADFLARKTSQQNSA